MPKSRVLLAALAVVTVAVTVLFILRGYREGNVTWEATADRGDLAASASTLSGVGLCIFDGSTIAVRVSAQSLIEEERTLTLRGEVRGETDKDLKLSTDSMTWTESLEKLEAGPTLLTLGTDELFAETFAYDTRLRRAELTQVDGTLRRVSTLVFSSDRGAVSESEIALDGNVRVAATEANFDLVADSLIVSDEGWTARGGVAADIELSTLEEDDGA
jgi:hypothetical protein